MPYLAFDLEAMEKAPNVARAAHITEDAAIAGMARMWKHCWHEKTDEVNAVTIQGFFGADAAIALVAFKFLEPQGTVYRVRGAARYLRIAKGKSEGGKKAARNLIPGGPGRKTEPPPADPEPSGPLGLPSAAAEPQPSTPLGSGSALTPSTEHRTPIKKPQQQQQAAEVDPPVATSRVAPTSAPQLVPDSADFEPDDDGRYAIGPWGFWGWHTEARHKRSLFDEGRPPDTWKAWCDAALAKVGPDGLSGAYLRYLDDDSFAQRGWPVRVFMSEAVWLPRANSPPEKQVRL